MMGRTTTTVETIGTAAATFGYTYDDQNRVTALTYPDGEVVRTTYDVDGSPLVLQGAPASGTVNYVSSASYNALSQPLTRVTGDTLLDQWSYTTPLSRLTRRQLGTSAQSPSSRLDRGYTYDAVGNLTALADNLPTGRPSQQFTYDALDRLTHAVTSGYTGGAAYDETDSYDPVGNFVAKGTATYSYSDTAGQYRPKHAPSSVGTDAYTYDLTGNVLTGAGRTYQWNAQGLPTSITSPLVAPVGTPAPTPPGPAPNLTSNRVNGTTAGAPNVTSNRVAGTTSATQPNLIAANRAIGGGGEAYSYDAGGARLTRIHDGITTRYFGLWEQDSTGTTRSLYSFGGGAVAQREKVGGTGGGTLVYLHGDHLGSASTVTDTSGSVLSQTEYGPWGATRANSTGVKPTTIDYTGQRKDGTGLLYYGARYYDPVLGRFLSPDSASDGVNPYSYVHNNPLSHTDPTGHCANLTDCDKETGATSYAGGFGGNGNGYGGNGNGSNGGGGEPNNPGAAGPLANPAYQVAVMADPSGTGSVATIHGFIHAYGFNVEQLAYVGQTFNILADFVGGYNTLSNLVGGVLDLIYGGVWGNKAGYWALDGDPTHITLFEAAFTNPDFGKTPLFNAEWTIVHEVGHRIDWVSQGVLPDGTGVHNDYYSQRLEQLHYGHYAGEHGEQEYVTSTNPTGMSEIGPSSYAHSNNPSTRREYWAESFAATIFGGPRESPYAEAAARQSAVGGSFYEKYVKACISGQCV